MTQFIDRRLNPKNKSALNRQRFLQRYKKQIKKSVSDSIAKRTMSNINQGEQVILPEKDISEPTFQHGKSGKTETIYPGNQEFLAGDHISKPKNEGKNSGNQASNTGKDEDNFTFELSREEFLELYFDDLALPDLVKKSLVQISEEKSRRAGFSNTGVNTNINVVRSMRQATGRRLALKAPYKKQLSELKMKYEELEKNANSDSEKLADLKKRIQYLEKKIKNIPYIDTIDLRYNRHIKEPKPTTQAVMFCLMDVSGSMDEMKKNIAKRFFILLYLFLTKSYEKIELVFIRHHTSAKEVTETEFFNSRETGGTVVSSALELMNEIIQLRYPNHNWNIYAAQASDGDNWNADSPYCKKILVNQIMPKVQYFAYVEIMPHHHQSLWEVYTKVKGDYPNFAMQHINDLTEIYPVFRELFQRKAV